MPKYTGSIPKAAVTQKRNSTIKILDHVLLLSLSRKQINLVTGYLTELLKLNAHMNRMRTTPDNMFRKCYTIRREI